MTAPKAVSHQWPDLLNQGEIWIDREGRRLAISEMNPTHCQNVRNFLMRNSGGFLSAVYHRVLNGPQPSGDMASDGFDGILAELEEASRDPIAWITGQPLLVALAARAADGAPVGERKATGTKTLKFRLEVEIHPGMDEGALRRKIESMFNGVLNVNLRRI